jgi:hypothetical protein
VLEQATDDRRLSRPLKISLERLQPIKHRRCEVKLQDCVDQFIRVGFDDTFLVSTLGDLIIADPERQFMIRSWFLRGLAFSEVLRQFRIDFP